ncbi:MAG TPA: signal peptide peptidase SppA [Rhodocyclaceae bacterium]|nr:signal peptide peptidase SppA [Rhodocyclaceae bacterium]
MIKGLFRFIGRLFGFLFVLVDVLRRTFFNLVFLLIVAVVVALLLRPALPLPQDSALVVRPAGVLVEQARIEDPFALLRPAGVGVGQTPLRDLLEAINAARDDARISALVIETDDFAQGGLSKLAELRAAIEAFKTSGKPVFARGERFTQPQYYLASAADEVHLSDDGFVLLRGLARYVTYFKNALDALGVKVHVFRVGEYKSFSEPFTRADMSDEDRDSSRDLLAGLWNLFREDVAASRGIALEALDAYVLDFGAALAASDGNGARAALDAGLVDRFSTRDEWTAWLKERVGVSDDGEDFRGISLARYLATIRAERPSAAAQVAVLVAQGSILDGSGTPGAVGGDTLARLIGQVRDDPRVKAVVLRIDSPGGSAWASELIRRELELTRKAGKPVVASMSSTAASGGYWIAAGADEIWAHPATLTGSIGIFAMFPEFAEPLSRMGVTVDGVATGPLAGAFDPRRPLEPLAAEALQLGIEHGYRRFIETVAHARDMSTADVERIAQGRVWTGQAADKLGLVDQLGGLDAAVAAAARRAGLERFEVVWPEAGLSARELLLRRFAELTDFVPSGRPVGADSSLGGLLEGLRRDAEALLEWNDPRHLYTHCLCEGP